MTGRLALYIGDIDPFRYRGYFYDDETGLYYLQSRYYNPALGRFINADSYASTGQGLLGTNMFAYCLNNPVNYYDACGEFVIAASIAAEIIAELLFEGCLTVLASAAIYEIGSTITRTIRERIDISSGITIAIPYTDIGSISGTGTINSYGYNGASKASTRERTLKDVKVKEQSGKPYRLAYISVHGGMAYLGKPLSFQEALVALGFTGATNSVKQRFSYDSGRSSSAQRTLQAKSSVWGIYATSQSAAKALAVVLCYNGKPEVHGSGMYGHYHDGNHVFHIWFGGVIRY